MGSFRDTYSNFGYYNAFPPGPSASAAGATNGNTIDLKGFNAAALATVFTSYCSDGANGAGDYFILKMQHGLASALGVSAWSNVPASMLIHSVIGGYDSTAETGVLVSYMSASELTGSTQGSVPFKIGYKGDTSHRYLRLVYSNVGDASAVDIAAVWVIGQPNNWPVNVPINIS